MWPATAVAQPASTAILNFNQSLSHGQVRGGISGPWDFRRGRAQPPPLVQVSPEMVVGPLEDIEPRSQAMISGADGGDQFCC